MPKKEIEDIIVNLEELLDEVTCAPGIEKKLYKELDKLRELAKNL